MAIAEWNLLWEAAQFRRRFFAEDQIAAELREIARMLRDGIVTYSGSAGASARTTRW